jgi:hypothetical protein
LVQQQSNATALLSRLLRLAVASSSPPPLSFACYVPVRILTLFGPFVAFDVVTSTCGDGNDEQLAVTFR